MPSSWKIVKATMSSSKHELNVMFMSILLLMLVYHLQYAQTMIIYPLILSLTVIMIYLITKFLTITRLIEILSIRY